MTTRKRAAAAEPPALAPSPGRYRRGVRLSIRQISEETGRARDTISSRLRDGGLEPDARERFRLKDVLACLAASDDGQSDPARMEPHQRAAHYKAEESKQRLMVAARQLIPAAEMRDGLAHVFKLVAQTLETIPDILERDCGLKPHEIETVEKHVDKLRTDLADKLKAGEAA